MKAFFVSHTHWDREWHHTHQAFRARLVDAIDRLLELCRADAGYRFLLDGQTIVLEDYLEIRPERRGELEALCREGRIAIGPWYVQPDSLLPSGESQLRNLLEGRRVGEAIGPVSRIAYTPDSFGHPAQFPQLFKGMGLQAFLYWRGNGDEVHELPAEYSWRSPDGSSILACHLGRGYFCAATAPEPDLERAADRIVRVAGELAERTSSNCVLLLNGIDHAFPEPRTRELAESVAKRGGFEVQRGLLEDFVAELPQAPEASFRGELLGGAVANLLPGVWSTRSWIKLRNRRCEDLLLGWAEPWSALAQGLGLPDERPALRQAWRALLPNHAHDSICGCSRDRVHEQMRGRFDVAEELADETTNRVLERLAGLAPERNTPWTNAPELAVFNPSPHPRSELVRFALDPHPFAVPADGDSPADSLHPFLLQDPSGVGYTVEGQPARVVASEDEGRLCLIPGRTPLDIEFVAQDVPAFGWKRFRLEACDPQPEARDDGCEISNESVSIQVHPDGCFDVDFGEQRFEALGGLEDLGDRGDSYDFDPVTDGDVKLLSVDVERFRHPSGIQRLNIRRVLQLPESLDAERKQRSRQTCELRIDTELRVAPGIDRVDMRVRVDNTVRDHRLRMLFPTGSPLQQFETLTSFDVAVRKPGAQPIKQWIHPAPETFPHQGWVHANGLCVVAPGLTEAEVNDAGDIAITLLRCVSHLSQLDLTTRPGPAGPGTATPGAQCLGAFEARLWLLPGLDPRAARDAELGLRAVAAGAQPRVAESSSLLEIEPREILLSALKPAENGPGRVLRLLNPTSQPLEARVKLGFDFDQVESLALDESSDGGEVSRNGSELRLRLVPHQLRSLRIR